MSHHDSLSRRSFLQGAATGGALLGIGLRGLPVLAAEPTGKPAAGKIGDFKISLAEWSLHKALQAKKIDNLDFPRIAREEYGIEGVEYVNQFFKDKAHDSVYLKDLNKRAADHGVANVLIMIDNEGDLSAPEQADRAKAVVAYLVKKGVAAERLKAVGFGPDQPAASNDTPAGREQNRRVEFNLTR